MNGPHREDGQRTKRSGGARERFLAQAVELVERDGPGTADLLTAGVTPAAVADAADVARTQLYRWWPTKADLLLDLVTFLAASDLGPSLDRIAFDLGDDGRTSDIAGVARVQINALQHDLVRDPWVPLRTGLIAAARDDRLTTIVKNSTERAVRAVANQVEAMLASMGRTLIEPLAATDLATAIYCLADGTSVIAQLDEGLVAPQPAGRADAWGLLSFGVVTTLLGCSRPAGGAGRAAPSPAPLPPRIDVSTDDGRRVAALEAGAQLYLARLDEPALFRGLTIDRLARRAGVTPQAIRRHWSSQLDLALDVQSALYWRDAELLAHSFRRALAAVRRAQHDRLDAGFRSLLRSFLVTDRAPDRWLFAGHHHPSSAPSGVRAIRHALAHIMRDVRSEAGTQRAPTSQDHLGAITMLSLLTVSGAGRLYRTDPQLVVGPDGTAGRLSTVLERQLVHGIAEMQRSTVTT